MIINDTNAPAPTTARLEVIAAAYAPEDCEQCEACEATCVECAIDALHHAGMNIFTA